MLGIIMGAVISIAVSALSVTKTITVVGSALKALGNALMGIAKALGLIESEEKVEDLGDKAIQAEEHGIKPEDFSTYSEYVKSVEDFETDSERSKEISEDEKALKSIELTSGVTIEHFGDKFPVEEFFKFVAQHPEYFREDRMTEFGQIMENEPEKEKNIFAYMNGTENNDAKIEEAVSALKSIEKSIEPEISDREALYRAIEARIEQK